MTDFSWFDIGTRVVIPLVTFGLGIALSYAFRRQERRQDDERDHVRQLTALCSEWYDALASVYQTLVIRGHGSRDFREAMIRYMSGGTITSKLQMHRQALVGRDRYTNMLAEVDRLVDSLTIRVDNRLQDMLPDTQSRPRDMSTRLESMLQAADGRVQAIYQLAGEILGGRKP